MKRSPGTHRQTEEAPLAQPPSLLHRPPAAGSRRRHVRLGRGRQQISRLLRRDSDDQRGPQQPGRQRQRINEQVDKLLHTSTLYPNESHIELAENAGRDHARTDWTPSTLAPRGTDADETAVVHGPGAHRPHRDHRPAPRLQRQIAAGDDPDRPGCLAHGAGARRATCATP